MRVVVNGESREVADGCSAAQLVADMAMTVSGVAVAVDGEVLPRADWDTVLTEGATVEVLTAVQGG